MNYLFFGNAEFSVIVLERIIGSGFIPATVVCEPDKPVGRKQIITPPPVKQRIMNYESGIKDRITVWQPESLKTQNPAENGVLAGSSEAPDIRPRVGIAIKLADAKKMSSPPTLPSEPAEGFAPSEPRIPTLGPHSAAGSHGLFYQKWDFFIVAAYPKIIPKEILDIPRIGTIGIHPSLLPRHRGASPIQTAILEGDTETGVTLFLLDEKVDHGSILAQKALENHELGIMNYEGLSKKLSELSGDLLVATLPKFIAGEIIPKPQDEWRATYTKKFKTEDGYVAWSDVERAQSEGGEIAVVINRKIRALNPEPGVYTLEDNKRIKLLVATLVGDKLKLIKIQKEGKNPVLLK